MFKKTRTSTHLSKLMNTEHIKNLSIILKCLPQNGETNSCLDRNNWNLVRYLWVRNNIAIRQTIIEKDQIVYNCYGSDGRVNVNIVPAYSIVKQRIKVYGQKRVVHSNSKRFSYINGIKTKRNNSCSIIIKIQKSLFNHGNLLLLIVSNSISNLLPEEIPYYIENNDLKYILIGMTLHLRDHFIAKVYDSLNFYDINNLCVFESNPNN
ncbi:hypothetical protein BpHYR1_033499, partial [Brachionus plicatilis]